MNQRLLAMALALGSFLGCETVRKHTSPPTLQVITGKDVQASMRTLAADAYALEVLTHQEEPPLSEAQRLEIVRLLGSMQQSLAALGCSTLPSNHPLFEDHLDTFRESVALAKEGAEREPPNFFLAAGIAGACRACHVK